MSKGKIDGRFDIGSEYLGGGQRADEARGIAKDIKLNKFQPDKIKLDSFIVVCGKRRLGKTTWAHWLLYNNYKMFPDGGYVFTKTKHNYSWQSHFPDSRIYDVADLGDVLPTILEEQKDKVVQMIKSPETDADKCPNIVVVLDDVISDETNVRYSKILDDLCFSGRHYKMMVILCTQDIKGINPKMRQNADLVVLTYQSQERTLKTLQSDYADFFPNDRIFASLVRENTRDHKMLIIDQSEAKYNVNEIFFTDKAPEHTKPFRIGDQDFWDEAGCNWEEQLEDCENVPNYDREKWAKLAEKRWKKDKEKREGGNESKLEDDFEHRTTSNQLDFADEEIREAEYKERKGKRMTGVEEADYYMKNLVRYVPGPKYFET